MCLSSQIFNSEFTWVFLLGGRWLGWCRWEWGWRREIIRFFIIRPLEWDLTC
ncbi:hypothetical protein HanIR_Chr05g0246661 [Helianthus annuus]|nr:hypothetical protein HanIR_Chr05g0246661 [Helianthus annuus]